MVRSTYRKVIVDDIIIDNDTITTNASNGDINITTNGVGQVIIDNIQLSGNTVANPGGDIVLDPSSQNVTIYGTGFVNITQRYYSTTSCSLQQV